MAAGSCGPQFQIGESYTVKELGESQYFPGPAGHKPLRPKAGAPLPASDAQSSKPLGLPECSQYCFCLYGFSLVTFRPEILVYLPSHSFYIDDLEIVFLDIVAC